MTETILIIEDDPAILLGLRLNLSKAGYRIRTASDGHEGLAQLAKERPSLVLLDLMLPGVDGMEILRQIREDDAALPVVVLTALGNEKDKVKGLDLGANDYVTKPFGVSELTARVRAALRTASLGPSLDPDNILRAGIVELHKDTRSVQVNGVAVDLTTREFDLLLFLMERPERVLTREQILVNVWGADYEGTDRTVDNFVSVLRKKLQEDPDHPRHLRTVYGIGYRFVP